MAPCPEWFTVLSWSYLGLCFLCSLVMLGDEVAGNWQHMMIMNLVWPITALYWGPAALWGYFSAGKKMTHKHKTAMEHQGGQPKGNNPHGQSAHIAQGGERQQDKEPTSTQIALSDSHCGAGCTLGDISAEWWVAIMGLMFAGTEFGTRLVLDFLLAWSYGVIFQYFHNSADARTFDWSRHS